LTPRTPRVTPDEMIRVLERLGFTLARQSGSHRMYKNSAGRRATVSYHKAEILHPKVLANILDDAGITVEEFMRLLGNT